MELKSKALNANFEFVTFEKKGDRGQNIRIILHDSLQDVIHNQVKTGLRYSFEIVSADPAHSVVICSMTDKDGREVREIGESIPKTLDSEIASNYPTLIASQRAFDRAAIRYLDLPGKVFSNMEIDISDITDVYSGSPSDTIDAIVDDTPTPSATTTKKPSGIVSSVVEDISDTILEVPEIGSVDEATPDANPVSEPASKPISETPTTSNDTQEEIPDLDIPELDDSDIDIDIGNIEDVSDSDELPFDDNSANAEDDVGNYVITMRGKYEKENLTISEIYKKDANWVEWISKNFVPRNDVAKRDVEHLKKFVASLKK